MRIPLGLCLGTALACAAPVCAFAADPYGYPSDPPNFGAGNGYAAPVVTNWSGIYVGGQFGGGFGAVGDGDLNGPAVGGTLGVSGQWNAAVFGIEGDGSYAPLAGSYRNGDFEMGAFGTVRGRVGYAFDRFLAYGTAGVAIASVDKTSGIEDSQTFFGWTAGGGIEVALTPNVSAKLEYLYADLGSRDFKYGIKQVPVDISANIVRAGVNYRF